MKRLNARGLKAANKMLLLAATVYNLKKWLKFSTPKTNIKVVTMLKTEAREAFVLIKTALFKPNTGHFIFIYKFDSYTYLSQVV